MNPDGPEPASALASLALPGLARQIVDTVGGWPGVVAGPHRYGGIEFRVGRRELGHLHGDRFADLPFPIPIRNELIAARRASPHHVLPESGWVTFYISGPEDLPALIELFRLNYDRARPKAASAS